MVNQLSCEYTRSSSRGSRRGKKSHRRSTEVQSRDDSPGNARSLSRASSEARSHRRSPQQGTPQPPKQQQAGRLTPSAPSSTQQKSQSVFDELDFSLLTPLDSFDLSSLSQPPTSADSHPGHYTVVSAAGLSDGTSMYDPGSPVLSSMTPGFPPYHQPVNPHHHSMSPQPDMNMEFSNPWSSPFHAQYIDPAMSSTPGMHGMTMTSNPSMGYPEMQHEGGGGFYMLPSQQPQNVPDQRYWNEHGRGWGWRS